MLRESMQGAKTRVEAEDARIRQEQQSKETQYQKDILNVKKQLDWFVYSIYKQICDTIADKSYRAGSNAMISGYISPQMPQDLFLRDGISMEFAESGFSTNISLEQAKRIFDKIDSGIGDVYEFYSETRMPAIVLAGSSSYRGGLGIFGYTDTKTYTLTKAGSLIVNEVVRLGQNEGISIVPGVLFTLNSHSKKSRTGEETFVKLRLGTASFKHNSDYFTTTSLSFQYTYAK